MKNKELKNKCRLIGQLDYKFAYYNLSGSEEWKIWWGMNPPKKCNCSKRAYRKFCNKHSGDVYVFPEHPIWDRITE